MKKFLIIVLTFFYFGTSSGMVYELHQCLESISIFAGNSNKTCNLCKAIKKKDCCKTQFKILIISPAHKADLLKIDFLKYVAVVPKAVYINPVYRTSSTDYSSVRINAPPEREDLALFIRDCNFRI